MQTFALTTSEDARNQLSLIWGVQPFYVKGLTSTGEVQDIGDTTMFDLMNTDSDTTEEMLKTGERTLLAADVVVNGETMIMMAGRLSGLGLSSSVIVWSVGEEVARR
jgi:pyruvate kinase